MRGLTALKLNRRKSTKGPNGWRCYHLGEEYHKIIVKIPIIIASLIYNIGKKDHSLKYNFEGYYQDALVSKYYIYGVGYNDNNDYQEARDCGYDIVVGGYFKLRIDLSPPRKCAIPQVNEGCIIPKTNLVGFAWMMIQEFNNAWDRWYLKRHKWFGATVRG